MSEAIDAKIFTEKISNYKKISNRFGEFSINLDKKIFFYNGILGMPGYRNFCLTEIPNTNNNMFKLFQSVEDEETAFIVMPLILDENNKYPIIENIDIKLVAEELELTEESIVVLLIANFVKNNDKSDVFVNARAPIIIDSEKQGGLQYVFANDKYDIKLKITE